MKKQLLKSSLWRGLLSLLFLMAMVGNAWGTDVTGTINFGSGTGDLAINSTSVNGDDSQGNNWTVTTVMTETSFTQNEDYSQIGAAKKPATSITFTTTLPASQTISSFSAKFGGFSGTAGTVTLKVGDTTVGTGSLSGTTDVTVSNTNSTTAGTVLTVTVTGISKGVKAYYISYTYSEGGDPALVASKSSLPKLSYEEGSGPSTAETFTVSGQDLTANATVTAPTNFEVSSDDTNYSSSVTLTQTSGSIASTTVYVRLAAGLAKSAAYAGNVTVTSTGATTKNIAVTGEVEANKNAVAAGTYNIVPGNSLWGTSYTSSNSSTTANGLDLSGTVYGVTFNLKNGSSTSMYVTDEQIRVYNNYTLKVTAPTGYKLTNITFTADGTNWAGTHTASVGTMTDNKTWDGSASEVTISFKGTCRCTNIAVTYAAIPTPSFSIADVTANVNDATNVSELLDITTNNTDSYTISYESSDASVAKISDGKLYAYAEGSCTITATMGATENFKEATTTFTVTVEPAVTKYTVCVSENDRATLSANPTSAAKDATVTLSYSNVAEHYHFKEWTVLDGSANSVDVDENDGVYTFTMPASEVTVDATFVEDDKHNVTFSINGVAGDPTPVYEGDDITFPEDSEDIHGKKFVGWTEDEIEGATDTKPTFVTSPKMGSNDVTYYAVFATVNVGETQTATLTASGLSTATYKSGTQTDSQSNTWSYYASVNNLSGTLYFGLNSNESNYNIGSPVFGGVVKSIAIKAYNGSATADRKLYICSSNSVAQPASGDIDEITISKSEQFTNTYKADLSSAGDFSQFYIYAAAALGISEVTVTYAPTSYSDYCTAVPDYVNATISENCYDTNAETGDKTYYSTFSTSQYIKVPAGVTVSEVGLNNEGTLKVASYQTGDVVETGRGLLISSATSGTKYFEVVPSIPEAPATATCLGEGNLLQGTNDDAIDATTMKQNPANCLYYRLTMHNGSKIGFWWGAENGAAFGLGANKAYLAVPKTKSEGGTDQGEGGLVKSYWFGNDDATAISQIENGKLTIENGKYLEDGKIVIVKNGKKYNTNGQRIK